MINIKNVMTFARTETRLTRRLVRYWLFVSISYLTAIIIFLIYSLFHGVYSSYSATEALLSPRYIIGTIGLYYLLFYTGGAVFLGFDVRARDQREQMNEILDSRPYTNLELVSGRFLGLLVSSWIPIFVLAFILEFIVLFLPLPFGDTIEVYSLFAFTFLMAIPALAFVLSLVFLVTLLIRNRLMAAVVLLILLGGDFWATLNLPSVYSPLIDLTGAKIINSPSDIIPSLTGMEGWLQRAGVFLAALGMLALSAAVHPRLDGGSPKRLAAGGAGIIILAILMTGFGFYKNINAINITDEWRKAHSAKAEAPVPDIRIISGNVIIDPGKALNLELDLTFRASGKEALKSAFFTLNPGQKVKEILDASDKPMNFTHENGLLEVILPRPLEPGEETVIHLAIDGIPDRRFGYLDCAVNTENLKGGQKNLSLLGLDRYIYDSRFVALMPGIRWLPASGTEKMRGDLRYNDVDFFRVDLTVDIPSGWLAAGPGLRRDVEGDKTDRVKFRFSPEAPVPEVALIASKFESRSFDIDGIKMELLAYPGHMKNIRLMTDTVNKIREWTGYRMKETGEYGLSYPYDALTLVEVPNPLRSFQGGWRMDTALTPPGLLLMRETTFPTARFDWPFRDPELFKDLEGGMPLIKFDSLLTFFTNDISGGNILSGASRNFFLDQTSARGQDANAINYVMEILSTMLVTETGTYFSAHNFTEEDVMGPIFGSLIFTRDDESIKKSMTDTTIEIATSSQEVWDQALKVSLRDMDLWDGPALKINVLALKANAIARCILDILGREKTAQLLSSIRDSYKGNTFSFDDMKSKCNAMGIDLDGLFGDWLGSTSMPGFICSKAEVYRLPDSENGMPRYQLLISVSNDEPAPGVFRIQYRVGTGEIQELSISDPIRIDGEHAARFGVILSQPPVSIMLKPYISLNRGPFTIDLNKVDHEKIINAEPVEGLENMPWSPPAAGPFIIIDNLDEGFEVKEGELKKDVKKGRRNAAISINDQGLSTSAYFSPPPEWVYLDLPGSWGKYRHTTAVVKSGEGENKATFTTTLHSTGSWELWLHMPDKQKSFPMSKFGTWSFDVKDSNGDQYKIEFNSDAALDGWNQLETMELPEGEVTVTLSDKTDGDLVLADAIRWSPSGVNLR